MDTGSAGGSVLGDTQWLAVPDDGTLPRRPLYADFYGLNESPFDLTPNPKFLFLARRHREALSNLRYALSVSRGFTVLIGDAGTGKTTLIRAALSEIGTAATRYALISNPTLSRTEFYEVLAREFGFSEEAQRSKARFLEELERDVQARFAAGGVTGLVVDEAQSMPRELLEEIRLLGNIETPTTKLLNIVLSGQPELADRLNDESLRQLKQRVALRCELMPLALDEAAAYISGRLRIAGGNPGEIFTRETVIEVHRASAGIPRTINVLCDNILIGGFAAQVKPIPLDIVDEVFRDFDVAPRKGAGAINGPAAERPAPTTELAAPRAADALPPAADDREMFGSLPQTRRRRFSFFSL